MINNYSSARSGRVAGGCFFDIVTDGDSSSGLSVYPPPPPPYCSHPPHLSVISHFLRPSPTWGLLLISINGRPYPPTPGNPSPSPPPVSWRRIHPSFCFICVDFCLAVWWFHLCREAEGNKSAGGRGGVTMAAGRLRRTMDLAGRYRTRFNGG